MHTKILSNSISVVSAVAASLLLIQIAFAAPSVTFPIQELGNCADQAACRAYCADSANHDVCEAFAEANGLPHSNESEKTKATQEDGGPGGCASGSGDPQASCKAYCDQSANIKECVAYGKKHGFLKGEELSKAERVAAALASGAKLPAGCADASSCKEVCENPSSLATARECFMFAKTAGILPPHFDEVKAEKVFQVIADGSAPFKSPKEFARCENPEDDDTLQKCVDFGVKSGFISAQEADVIKKTGGKGPGGCRGKDECETYCEEHGDECFRFGKENGLVTPEQEERMQEGMNRLKENLSRAPAGVQQCIIEAIGGDRLDAVLSGSTRPDSSIGEKMRGCFDTFLSVQREEREREGKNGRGENGLPFGRPQGAQGEGRDFNDVRRGQDPRAASPRPTGDSSEGPHGIPPQVRGCLMEKFGSDAVQKMERQGGAAQGEFGQAIAECSQQINPEFQNMRKKGDDARFDAGAADAQSSDREMPVELRRPFNVVPQEKFDENSLHSEVPLRASPFMRPEDSAVKPFAE